jgi:hypothetical protein
VFQKWTAPAPGTIATTRPTHTLGQVRCSTAMLIVPHTEILLSFATESNCERWKLLCCLCQLTVCSLAACNTQTTEGILIMHTGCTCAHSFVRLPCFHICCNATIRPTRCQHSDIYWNYGDTYWVDLNYLLSVLCSIKLLLKMTCKRNIQYW